MKTIEMTDEQYITLLKFKNFVSMKITGYTNEEVTKRWKTGHRMPEGLDEELDFDTTYTFGDCIVQTIGSVLDEQQTGQVNYIT